MLSRHRQAALSLQDPLVTSQPNVTSTVSFYVSGTVLFSLWVAILICMYETWDHVIEFLITLLHLPFLPDGRHTCGYVNV